jgi:hypothetical protein
MPKGLKETSSIITVGANVLESAANTFTSQQVDLQLNPLDNEVFVVYGIDLDVLEPNLVPGVDTLINCSVSTTTRTTVGNISNSNVLSQTRIEIQSAGGETARGSFSSDSGPATQLEYLGIIATNDFFVNIQGTGNALARSGSVRLYGVRARADASIYAALVQSELLSAWGGPLDRNMMLTPDEYMSLMRLITSERESEGASLADRDMGSSPTPVRKRSRSARAADKKLSKAFKMANARYRKKDGSLRSGRVQADIARLAHKLRKKMWARMGIPHPSTKTNELLLKILKELRLLRKDLKK